MNPGIIITVSIVIGLLILFLTLNLVFSLTRRKMEKIIRDQFEPDEILAATTSANFFGKKSLGGKQIRGNGALVLTRDELFFCRAVPGKEYRIPVTSIRDVSMPRSSNGRSILTPLLCVRYETGGSEDALAWAVNDPRKWKAAIDNLTH